MVLPILLSIPIVMRELDIQAMPTPTAYLFYQAAHGILFVVLTCSLMLRPAHFMIWFRGIYKARSVLRNEHATFITYFVFRQNSVDHAATSTILLSLNTFAEKSLLTHDHIGMSCFSFHFCIHRVAIRVYACVLLV